MLNKRTIALLNADIVWFFGEGMLGPLFAVFTERIGGDIMNITWAWATYLIVMGVLIVVFGKLSDTLLDKKKLLFLGYALNAVFTFGYLLVNNTYSLLLLQAGLGVAAAMATPTWDALYSKYENKKKDGLIWGLSDGLSKLFTGIAIIIGGLIVVYFSFSTLFIVMGTIQIVSVICLIPIFKKGVNRKILVNH